MATKYGKSLLLLIFTSLIMTGCKTVSQSAPKIQPKLTDTPVIPSTAYLPYLKVNEQNGEKLFYQPEKNPYLVEKGPLEQNVVNAFIEARKAIRAAQYVKAKSELNKVIEANGKLSGPYVLLGDIARKEEQSEKAIEAYERAIEVNSNNINAYLKLAIVLRREGQFSAAKNVLVKALAVWPDFPEAHFNLSVIYDNYLNQPEIAQKHLEAYQMLTNTHSNDLSGWLANLQERTKQPNYIEEDFLAKQKVILAKLEAERNATVAQAGN